MDARPYIALLTFWKLLLPSLLLGGCCFTQKCAAHKDAQWMRSTCRPIPTAADEQECIANVKQHCVRHGLPEDCGEPGH